MKTKKGENFVLEIGTEEIPARFLPSILEDLKEKTEKEFKENSLTFSSLKTFGTPRRLVLYVETLSSRQPDITEEIKGPPKQVAFDTHGNPGPAALGFAKNQGVPLSKIFIKAVEGKEYLFVKIKKKGEKTEKILPKILKEILENLSLPIAMSWGEGLYKFVRPVQWILALFGEKVVDFDFAGQKAGRLTFGHPFVFPDFKEVPQAEKYFSIVRNLRVIIDPQERKSFIIKGLEKFGAKISEDLLEEVIYLVEDPFLVIGSYKQEFQALPIEILELAMEKYQKYFPVKGANNFVVVADGVPSGELKNIKIKNIREGNEKVLTARLTDAKFFYEHDLKTPLSDLLKNLKEVTFHKNLGTLFDKVERIGKIAFWLFEVSGFRNTPEEKVARRALGLLKNDLMTQLVGEIDVLQGIAGRIYAKAQGYPEEVALAIEEHYHPRFSGDTLPKTPAGEILAISDKIDNLVVFFTAGIKPSGSSDPLALRRSAMGVVLILLNEKSYLKFRNLYDLIDVAFESIIGQANDIGRGIKLPPKIEKEKIFKELEDFIFQRLRQILIEENFRYDLIETVLAGGLETNLLILRNIRAILKMLLSCASKDWFKSFVETAVRVKRLGAQGTTDEVNEKLLIEKTEKELFEIAQKILPVYENHLLSGNWEEAIFELRQLIRPVDQFFIDVMVMVEDEALRTNRLALLRFIDSLFKIIGDFEKVVL